jgi:hypothetical protein
MPVGKLNNRNEEGMRKVLQSLTVFGLVLLVVAPSAHAYVDPGSGSMLLQLLLGGVAGVTILLKWYWQRFLALFGGEKKEPELLETSPLQSRAQPDSDDRKP